MGKSVAKPGRLTVQGKAVSEQSKALILEDAKQLIPSGASLVQIASKHGIAERTLEYWLASLGDEYIELRQLWIDNLLHEAGELLKDRREDGAAGLRLARARELWKRATWYAERRDRARYGQDQMSSSAQAVVINIDLGAAKSSPNEGQVIDIKADRE